MRRIFELQEFPFFTRASRMIRGEQIAAVLLVGAASPTTALLAAEDFAHFETHIRPLLAEHCYECHSEESGKRKGGLLLDSRAGWKLGGDSGAAVVPGHPGDSLLLRAIRYEDPDLEMPPEEKLSEEQIRRVEAWIRRGAPDPRDGKPVVAREESIDLEAGREFWSFQSVTKPEPPEVAQAEWPRGAIDRFLLHELESHGLRPPPGAGCETLLRRASLVLTGMPPTVEEQDAFLADSSPGAWARVVDRLLSSDEYAERWGRQWLDLCRYADTSGRALTLQDAWRFRDYVIESFRRDKPLDQLIREHIAGDLLPALSVEDRMEKQIATGFLVLGPHNYENQDKDLLELEIADEQIDTIGRAFLGMTIGCARCHDHKFDPIPARDYYALAGIFLSTESVENANVSKWHTRPYRPTPEQEEILAEYERKSKRLRERIDFLKEEITRLGQVPGKGPGAVSAGPVPASRLRGVARDDQRAELEGDWQLSTHSPRWVGEGYLHDQHESGVTKSVTWRLPVEGPGRYEVRLSYSANGNRASNAPVTVRHAGGETRVRVDQRTRPSRDGLFQPVGVFEFERGEALVRVGNEGADGVVIADAVQLLREGEADRSSLTEPPATDLSDEDARLAKAYQKEYGELRAELKALERTKPKVPTIMAVVDAEEPGDTPLRIRGMARNFGETVPRGFLQVVQGGPSPQIGPDRSGRLELARWITSPENPLTARVLANRIWLHMFGEGLVGSPDNFGTTGEPPSHPELLDYLAARLVEHGWSTKGLIREIMLSRAWRMSAKVENPRAKEVDPENRLLWRAHRRRLEAESLRDSVLALAGRLEATRGGPSLPKGFKSEFGYEFTSRKRSVYIPVFRNRMHEIFAAFDFANPNFVVGKRGSSVIPTQSLFLLNSAFMHEQARAAGRRWASEPPAEAGSKRERIIRAYRTVLSRHPHPEELRLSLEYLERELAAATPEAEAWSALALSLFSCVDFQYIP